MIRFCPTLRAPVSLAFIVLFLATTHSMAAEIPNVTRLGDGPIIVQDMDARMGGNVQGPSLIKVPDWVESPLGEYYLYFADHRGTYIRMAYADDLLGPWTTYEQGTLQLEESFFPVELEEGAAANAYAHIASPDVHVRGDLQEIVMYVHGRDARAFDSATSQGLSSQVTRLATSKNGIDFVGQPEILGRPYFRVIQHGDYYYGLAMPGFLYRSKDGITDFEEGPRLFNNDMRHSALLLRDDTLYVFWTQVGHEPERILLSTIELDGDWMSWQESQAVEVLRPETEWEGANLPIEPSQRGHSDVAVNQLRDPAIFEEDGEVYLLYSVAGESGIAIARLQF